jgi:hypothetical protein
VAGSNPGWVNDHIIFPITNNWFAAWCKYNMSSQLYNEFWCVCGRKAKFNQQKAIANVQEIQ